MSIDELSSILFWCSLINLGLLCYWFFVLLLAKDMIFKWHTGIFSISKEDFYRLHYQGMMFYKLLTFMFFVIPYLVVSYLV